MFGIFRIKMFSTPPIGFENRWRTWKYIPLYSKIQRAIFRNIARYKPEYSVPPLRWQ